MGAARPNLGFGALGMSCLLPLSPELATMLEIRSTKASPPVAPRG